MSVARDASIYGDYKHESVFPEPVYFQESKPRALSSVAEYLKHGLGTTQ